MEANSVLTAPEGPTLEGDRKAALWLTFAKAKANINAARRKEDIVEDIMIQYLILNLHFCSYLPTSGWRIFNNSSTFAYVTLSFS